MGGDEEGEWKCMHKAAGPRARMPMLCCTVSFCFVNQFFFHGRHFEQHTWLREARSAILLAWSSWILARTTR